MSNPVSNADVEDVLESIRRLVSEHKKPGDPSATDAPRPDDVLELQAKDRLPAESDKLILTASHRVASDSAPEHSNGVDVSGGPDWLNPDLVAEDSVAEPIAEAPEPFVLSEIHKDDSDAAPEGIEPQADISSSEMVDDIEEIAEAPFEEMAEPEAEEPTATIQLFDKDAAEDTAVEDMLEQGGETPSVESSEAAEPTDTSDDETAMLVDEVIAEDASVDADGATDADPFTNEEVTRIENRAARQMKLGAKIAALEAVIGRRDDQWEPDGVDEDAYSGTAQQPIEWQDAEAEDDDVEAFEEEGELASDSDEADPTETAVSELVATPVTMFRRHASEQVPATDKPPVEGDMVVADNSASDALDIDIDEDALRVLVTDIVREELQGPLGERITRNVRKLVRREIHRALVSKDFD